MGYQPKSPPSILKSANCPSHPFLGNSHLYIGFSWNPLKIGFFSEPPLTPSHLLKVTKFLVKISQFKFLVMTKKNSFVYKLFLLLNISDFSSVCHKKSHTPLSSNPPLKIEILSSPPPSLFWKFGRRPTPAAERVGCTPCIWGCMGPGPMPFFQADQIVLSILISSK